MVRHGEARQNQQDEMNFLLCANNKRKEEIHDNRKST